MSKAMNANDRTWRLALVFSLLWLLSGCASPPAEVTDEEARRAYDRISQAAPKRYEYNVRHILVERQEQATNALQRIKAGEPFAQVADQVSADPSSNRKGGDLGWSLPEHFAPEFSEAMVALAPMGMSTPPVRSRFGWHIIEVREVRERPFPDFELVKDIIKKKIAEDRRNAR